MARSCLSEVSMSLASFNQCKICMPTRPNPDHGLRLPRNPRPTRLSRRVKISSPRLVAAILLSAFLTSVYLSKEALVRISPLSTVMLGSSTGASTHQFGPRSILLAVQAPGLDIRLWRMADRLSFRLDGQVRMQHPHPSLSLMRPLSLPLHPAAYRRRPSAHI